MPSANRFQFGIRALEDQLSLGQDDELRHEALEILKQVSRHNDRPCSEGSSDLEILVRPSEEVGQETAGKGARECFTAYLYSAEFRERKDPSTRLKSRFLSVSAAAWYR